MNIDENFLPDPEDWNRWFLLEQKFDLYDLIDPQILSVLLCCIEYQVIQRRPPTLDELFEHINETCENFFPTMKSLTTKKTSTRSLLLRKLEEKKIISIVTVQKWRKNNKLNEKINGKSVFYEITETGIILYELMLNFPYYSFLLVPNWQDQISHSHLTLTRGISSTKNRICYSKKYFENNNIEIKEFDLKLFSNISTFLGEFELTFWKMCNPLTYILRERSLVKYFTAFLASYVLATDRLKAPISKIESKSKFGTRLIITNYKTALYEQVRMFGAIYYTYTLVPSMKAFSFDENTFESYSPIVPKDNVYSFREIDYLSGFLYFNEFS